MIVLAVLEYNSHLRYSVEKYNYMYCVIYTIHEMCSLPPYVQNAFGHLQTVLTRSLYSEIEVIK